MKTRMNQKGKNGIVVIAMMFMCSVLFFGCGDEGKKRAVAPTATGTSPGGDNGGSKPVGSHHVYSAIGDNGSVQLVTNVFSSVAGQSGGPIDGTGYIVIKNAINYGYNCSIPAGTYDLVTATPGQMNDFTDTIYGLNLKSSDGTLLVTINKGVVLHMPNATAPSAVKGCDGNTYTTEFVHGDVTIRSTQANGNGFCNGFYIGFSQINDPMVCQ